MRVDATEPVFGAYVGEVELNTHGEDECAGEFCVVHKPSDHHMRDWKLTWRGDKGVMERACSDHGIGHPDPDDLAYHVRNGREYLGVHGCCGCCTEKEDGNDYSS